MERFGYRLRAIHFIRNVVVSGWFSSSVFPYQKENCFLACFSLRYPREHHHFQRSGSSSALIKLWQGGLKMLSLAVGTKHIRYAEKYTNYARKS